MCDVFFMGKYIGCLIFNERNLDNYGEVQFNLRYSIKERLETIKYYLFMEFLTNPIKNFFIKRRAIPWKEAARKILKETKK